MNYNEFLNQVIDGGIESMSEQTKIQWCDHTFNPWEGCTKVSPGCAHCYAETRNHRFGNDNWGKGKPRRRTSAANWKQPLKWNREAGVNEHSFKANPIQARFIDAPWYRPRVFCASLADWLDDEVPIWWLADLLRLIYETPNLDWLLLSKRLENFYKRLDAVALTGEREDNLSHGEVHGGIHCVAHDWVRHGIYPHNVWLGVSIEDQKRADERIPLLLRISAKVRFLSVEPMLGPVDLNGVWREYLDVHKGIRLPARLGDAIHWAIFGGESGPGARPCNVDWIRDGVRQCRAAGVAPFVKQLGSSPVYDPIGDIWLKRDPSHPLRDKKGGEMSEWPSDLRIREFPNCKYLEPRERV